MTTLLNNQSDGIILINKGLVDDKQYEISNACKSLEFCNKKSQELFGIGAYGPNQGKEVTAYANNQLKLPRFILSIKKNCDLYEDESAEEKECLKRARRIQTLQQDDNGQPFTFRTY